MKELKYILSNAQHNIERDMSEFVGNRFPNYELLWSEYLMPLTGAPVDYNWRNDTLPNLEEIGMSHFGVLKSLNYIRITKPEVKAGDPYQRFKNVYFHFGLIFDSVDNLARNLWLTQKYLKIKDLNYKMKRSQEDLKSDFNKWVNEKYDRAYDDMIRYGKPIFYYPQHDLNFISILISDRSFWKEYIQFIQDVKRYRNFFIHNPGVDIARRPRTGEQFAIKREKIHHCRYWSIFRRFITDHPEYFDDPKAIIEDDLSRTALLLNKLWESLIAEMDNVYNHRDFGKIFRNFQREE